MCAHHARATPPERAGPAFDPPIDPWLRMRLAPVHDARRPTYVGAMVRDALRAIASASPDPAKLALEMRPVRALLDRERERLRQRLAGGAPVAEIAHAAARLLDGTIIGLCHLGRLLEPGRASMVPPLAVIGRGPYGGRRLAPGGSAELLFLVAADPARREHGLAMARFVHRELAGLGWQASCAKRTVRGCLAETHLDPAIAADLAAARLVWGCHGLFAELRAGLGQALDRQGRAIWDTPEGGARPVLAA
jgi:UTP:GlnB (protein PII) uridylyltransferase